MKEEERIKTAIMEIAHAVEDGQWKDLSQQIAQILYGDSDLQ